MPILEPKIPSDAVKGFFHSRRNAGKRRAVLILLVLSIVVVETHPDRSVITRTGWARRLDGIATFPIALQIELLRDANVNVLGTADNISRIVPVDDGDRPIEIPVVGRASELDAALGRTKDHWIVRCARQACNGRLTVDVIRRQIDGLCLREWQIELELSEPYVQRILRQSDSVAQIAVLQPAVSHGPVGIGSVDGNVIINPEREVLAEAPRTYDRERVWGK